MHYQRHQHVRRLTKMPSKTCCCQSYRSTITLNDTTGSGSKAPPVADWWITRLSAISSWILVKVEALFIRYNGSQWQQLLSAMVVPHPLLPSLPVHLPSLTTAITSFPSPTVMLPQWLLSSLVMKTAAISDKNYQLVNSPLELHRSLLLLSTRYAQTKHTL